VKKKHPPEKRIPERWKEDYQSVTARRRLPEEPLWALKTAIEEIAILEVERDRLAEDASLLKTSLEDLQECRKNNIELLHERNGLGDELRRCRDHLAILWRERT
jgi:FtsZ-binding cell division protein ZapB